MEMTTTTRRKYWNPYLSGIGIGLTLLAAFVFAGRGIGVSGGLTTIFSNGIYSVAPGHAESNEVFNSYLQNPDGHPLADVLVFNVLGIFIGGFISGLFSKRIKIGVDAGPGISSGSRLILAFTGGVLMGFSAKIARGCTSGQALTGGALLNLGSWIFMLSLFAGAYALAYFVKRQWT